jgi:hypothetical protein
VRAAGNRTRIAGLHRLFGRGLCARRRRGRAQRGQRGKKIPTRKRLGCRELRHAAAR